MLESEDLSLGVVQAIAGQTRAEMTLYRACQPRRNDPPCACVTTPWRARPRSGSVAGGAARFGHVLAWWPRSAICARILGPGMSLPDNCAPASMCATRRMLFVIWPSLTLLAQADFNRQGGAGLPLPSKILMDQAAVAMDAGMCALATDADSQHWGDTAHHDQRRRS